MDYEFNICADNARLGSGDKQAVHPLWVLGLSHMKFLQSPGAWSLLPFAASVAIILYLESFWVTITLQNTIGVAGHW